MGPRAERKYIDLLGKVLTGTLLEDWRPDRVWSSSLSMMPPAHMKTLRDVCETAISAEIPGDFMECGVWKGGGGIMMAAMIDMYDNSMKEREVWLADSYAGMPAVDNNFPKDVGVSEHWHPTQGGQWLAVSSSEVVTNIARFNLSVNIHIVEGYFSTLKTRLDLPDKISVLHLDGDMYASTYEALEALYPRLSIGGFVVEDDFYNPGFATSQQACDDYLTERSIEEEIHRIPGEHSFGAYWRKTKEERRGH